MGGGADTDSRHPPQPAHDLLGVDAIAGLDGDVPFGSLAGGLDQVDGADVAAGVSDSGRDASKHPGPVGDLEPDGEAIAGARGDHSVASTPAGLLGGRTRDARVVTRTGTPRGVFEFTWST